MSYFAQSTGTPACATPTYTNALSGAPTLLSAGPAYYSSSTNAPNGYTDYFGNCVYKAFLSTSTTPGTASVSETMTGITGSGGNNKQNVEVHVIELSGDLTAKFQNLLSNTGSSTTPNFGVSTPGDQAILFGANTTYSTSGPSTWYPVALPSGYTLIGSQVGIGTSTNGVNDSIAIGYVVTAGTVSGSLNATARWGTIGIDVAP